MLLVAFTGAFFLVVSSFALVTNIIFARDLKSKDTIINKNTTGVLIYDIKNVPFFAFHQAREMDPVSLTEISPQLQEALIAAEDKTFYNHQGYSVKSIFAAFIANAKSGAMEYGGSTITQQLVKISLVGSKKSFFRKAQEIVLAKEIEERYTKDEILEMYLNTVYFGEGAFGIKDASKTYFNKTPLELTLAESALLAGLVKAPSELSPVSGNRDKALDRQKWILSEMQEVGYINNNDRLDALAEELVFQKSSPSNLSFEAPHFALMVKDWLVKEYGEERVIRSGFKVYTTLNLEMQRTAQAQLKARIADISKAGASNGAIVVMDPKTGFIQALVGSLDWDNQKFGKVNMAIAPRQPGSSFKPIVYVSAFEKKMITPATLLDDTPTVFANNYKPKNYDDKYRGHVSVRYALANSLNIPAVRVASQVGVPAILDTAKKFGITSLKTPSHYGPSLGLGTGEVSLVEMTAAYSAFANQGVYHPPIIITHIEDKWGNIIYKHQEKSTKATSPANAFLISSILSDSRARQMVFGNALNISRTAAVKTGTTQSYRDSWTLGYTPSLTIGVWVGNNDNKPMGTVPGSLGAAPIWRGLMEKYLAGTPEEPFLPPSGVVYRQVCVPFYSGLLREVFLTGTEPRSDCKIIITPTPVPGSPEEQQRQEEERRKEEERRLDEERKRVEEEDKKRQEEEKKKQEEQNQENGQSMTVPPFYVTIVPINNP